MSDTFSVEERSNIMRKVRSSGNKSTELALIALFQENGYTGWRRHYNVKGHPDFVFPKQKVAVFVDGCFWHGHDCRNLTPKQNGEYWQKKRQRNITHDRDITARFEERGWHVLRIWECELKNKNRALLLEKIHSALKPED